MSLLLIKFLVSIKNAVLLKKEILKFFFNIKFLLLVKLLYKEGLILDFWLEKNNTNIMLIVSLKHSFAISNFFTLKILSIPSRYLYFSAIDIFQLYEKNVLFFFSTSQGILTSLECKQQQIGGVLFFYVK